MKKSIYFVCLANKNGETVSSCILAEDENISSKIFFEKFDIAPSQIYGPFFKKRIKKQKEEIPVQLTGKVKVAIYNNWIVNFLLLENDSSKAFIYFKENMKNPSARKPKACVVNLEDLITE